MGEQLNWFKSSFSGQGANCVSAAQTSDGGMAIRDDKDSNSPVLRFTRDEWEAFLAGVHNDEFQLDA